MNLKEYIGDKNHPGKLVFSSDYTFPNVYKNYSPNMIVWEILINIRCTRYSGRALMLIVRR
jgi:hypothetical protein